jgi:hypothetical protein
VARLPFRGSARLSKSTSYVRYTFVGTLSATTGLVVGKRNTLFDLECVSGVVVLIQGAPIPGVIK